MSLRLPQPEVFEHSVDELPSEWRTLSVFAPLMSRVPSVQDDGPVRRMPPQTQEASTWSPAAPGLEPKLLERFQALMAREGWFVHSARMRFDRLYARDRLALGHTSAAWDLRQLSLRLFRLYDDPQPFDWQH